MGLHKQIHVDTLIKQKDNMANVSMKTHLSTHLGNADKLIRNHISYKNHSNIDTHPYTRRYTTEKNKQENTIKHRYLQKKKQRETDREGHTHGEIERV